MGGGGVQSWRKPWTWRTQSTREMYVASLIIFIIRFRWDIRPEAAYKLRSEREEGAEVVSCGPA